ncbi:MAG: hypothetical protein IPI82_03740 [Candidatus Microthrix sp.]|nr:hypothetical protein [Candidatus Microthrix sp.]MBK7321580.1 hypothetical protein [Candidatus Microthrix sp.]
MATRLTSSRRIYRPAADIEHHIHDGSQWPTVTVNRVVPISEVEPQLTMDDTAWFLPEDLEVRRACQLIGSEERRRCSVVRRRIIELDDGHVDLVDVGDGRDPGVQSAGVIVVKVAHLIIADLDRQTLVGDKFYSNVV